MLKILTRRRSRTREKYKYSLFQSKAVSPRAEIHSGAIRIILQAHSLRESVAKCCPPSLHGPRTFLRVLPSLLPQTFPQVLQVDIHKQVNTPSEERKLGEVGRGTTQPANHLLALPFPSHLLRLTAASATCRLPSCGASVVVRGRAWCSAPHHLLLSSAHGSRSPTPLRPAAAYALGPVLAILVGAPLGGFHRWRRALSSDPPQRAL